MGNLFGNIGIAKRAHDAILRVSRNKLLSPLQVFMLARSFTSRSSASNVFSRALPYGYQYGILNGKSLADHFNLDDVSKLGLADELEKYGHSIIQPRYPKKAHIGVPVELVVLTYLAKGYNVRRRYREN